MKIPSKIAKNYSSGFSLVEIIIALGLVTFAVTATVGLLPVGLTSLNQSMNQTVEAQILRSISSQCVVTKFDSLAANGLYFDVDGQSVSSADAYYSVKLSTNAPSYPGSAVAQGLPSSLVSLKVEIVARPNPTVAGQTNSYTLHVANSGK